MNFAALYVIKCLGHTVYYDGDIGTQCCADADGAGTAGRLCVARRYRACQTKSQDEA